MKRMKAGGLVVALLAAILAGCSDDDGEGMPENTGGTETAATSAESSEAAPTGNGTGATSGGADQPAVQRIAPQLVAPADNAIYEVGLVGGKVDVTFKWTVLPDVDSYRLRLEHEAGGSVYVEPTGTRDFPVGEYSWWVTGRYPVDDMWVEEGPKSEIRHFTVKQRIFNIL